MPVLYIPKGRAREYAPLAANLYNGCSHGCVYCYVPTIPPYKFKSTPRQEFHDSPRSRNDILRQLERDCLSGKYDKSQRVLLSFTTDPYQPIDEKCRLTRRAIEILHSYGYAVQILTKGGSRALYDLDVFTAMDAFASTMTLLSDKSSMEWEPGAALPSDRIEAIKTFYESKIPTWISLEPVINPDISIEIIRQTHKFVNLYKIGKINHHPLEAKIDWRIFALQAIEICESLCKPYYIKDDLASFLPVGALGPCHTTVAELERRILDQRQPQHIAAQVAHRQLALFPPQ